MSIERVIREMARGELRRQLVPLHSAIARLTQQADAFARLEQVLASRPPVSNDEPEVDDAELERAEADETDLAPVPVSRPEDDPLAQMARSLDADNRPCAIIGCTSTAKPNDDYCKAHALKRLRLIKSDRLPADWVPNPAPQSVREVVLRRGRRPGQRVGPRRDVAPSAPVTPPLDVVPEPSRTDGPCAINGCPETATQFGYCEKHDIKRRRLMLTDSLPQGWVDNAAPQSVTDLELLQPGFRLRKRTPETEPSLGSA